MTRTRPESIDLTDAVGFRADLPAAALAAANHRRRIAASRHNAIALAAIAAGIGMALFVLLA